MTTTDAAVPTDTSSAVDAATGRADGGLGPTEVARCESTAGMTADASGGQADRTCEHHAVQMRCGSERADVLADAFDCLLVASVGTGSCRTFSDPSGAATCLMELRDTTEAAHARTVAEHVVAMCPTASIDALLITTPVPMIAMSDATLDALDACITAAPDCDAAEACVLADVSDVTACYP